MALNIIRFLKGIKLIPVSSSSIDAKGEMEVLDSNGKLNYNNGSSNSPMVTESHSATLTNKTLTTPIINEIVTSTDTDLTLNPNGTGVVVTDSIEMGNVAVSGNTISSIDSNGDINITPNGTGSVVISDATIGVLDIDNINISGNTISSTNTNGDINITPNGSGSTTVTGSLDADYLTAVNSVRTGTISISGDSISADINTDLFVVASGTGTVNINPVINLNNLQVDTNTLSSTNTNGNIILDPAGTGRVQLESAINLPEISTPSTPSTGYGSIYFKSDGKAYSLNDSGTEIALGDTTGGITSLTGDVVATGPGAAASTIQSNVVSNGKIRQSAGLSVMGRSASGLGNIADITGSNDQVLRVSSNTLGFGSIDLAQSVTVGSSILPAANGGTGANLNSASGVLHISGGVTTGSAVVNADVSASADIARSKLAAGTADHVVINAPSTGAFSSEAQLAVSRGGTNIGSYTTGDILYASGSGTLSKLGIGSSGQALVVNTGVPAWGDVAAQGTINYITNANATTDTTGWATYSDAAQNIPVNGTGGTATGLTFSRSTSSPLIGAASFLIAQANSTSLQGKGVSYDFTIDSAFQAQPLSVSFNYNASSTFVASNGTTPPLNDGTTSTNAGNSDIEVFIYDVTNSVLLPVSPQVIVGNGANNFQFKGTFQTSPNSTSYRFILHCATTSANATGYTFKFDNVSVGPQYVSQGPVVTDWQSYTPTIAGFGTPSNVTFQYRRVGSAAEIRGKFTAGTVSGATATITMPSGITSASTSLIPTVMVAGVMTQTDVGNYSSNVLILPSATTMNLGIQSTGDGAGNVAAGTRFISSSTYSLVASFPVSGWSSNTLMSNDAATRVVAATVSGTPANWSANGIVIFPTVGRDTHGAYNAATGQFTAPVSGFYEVTAYVGSNNVPVISAYVAGVQTALMGGQSSSSYDASGTAVVYATAGQTIDVRASSAGGTPRASNLAIRQVQGPAQIAATGLIATQATGNAASASSGNPIIFPTINYDYTNSYNASTGLFTAPASGLYRVHGYIASAGAAGISLAIYNGSTKKSVVGTTDSNGEFAYTGSVQALAGDTLSVRPDGTLDVFVDSTVNFERIGI